MIRLRGVTHRYNKRHVVLTDASIEIPGNRRIALLAGPYAGKTTVLQILARQLTPWRGRVERSGRVSFIAGFHTAFRPTLSARQNFSFAAQLYGANNADVLAFIAEISGLGDLLDVPFRQLGLQNRISLTYLLTYALDFDTYLFDNIVGPWVSEIKDFHAICDELYKQKTKTAGSILATREPRVAARYCDCALLLRNHKLFFFNDLEEALDLLEDDRIAAESMPRRGRPISDAPGVHHAFGD
jgi:capsular polysaccharide transport system ATP-binding protein